LSIAGILLQVPLLIHSASNFFEILILIDTQHYAEMNMAKNKYFKSKITHFYPRDA